MGDRGRQLIQQRFTADYMVHQLTALYDDLLAAKRGGEN
jgi:hypothetical protein